MKSVIEGLFAGLVENNNISDKSKNNMTGENDEFSSDLNQMLFSFNQNNGSISKNTRLIDMTMVY